MKPTSYKNTPRYTQAMAAANARFASGPRAVNMGPSEVEAAFYQENIQRAAMLGHLGLQKDMFEAEFEEKGRQFDVSIGEKKRQFSASMGFMGDRFKYMRRQNNRAELLGMMNVGIGIGQGFQQYKHNKKMMDLYKLKTAAIRAQGQA